MWTFNETWNVGSTTCTVLHDDRIYHLKRDSHLAVYGGVVLQRLEVRSEGLYGIATVWLEKSVLVLWIKYTYHVAVFYSLLFVSSSGQVNTISASYRSVFSRKNNNEKEKQYNSSYCELGLLRLCLYQRFSSPFLTVTWLLVFLLL